MAIVFNKELLTTKLNLSFNNAIVEFYCSTPIQPLYATITIGTSVITLYPQPSGLFYYNLKDLINTILNTDNYADDLELDIDTAYTYDWSDKIYLKDDVVTEIFLANDTSQTDTRSISWLSGYVQLREWKQKYPALVIENDKVLNLSKSNTLKYWEGFPFDIGLFCAELTTINIVNKVNGLDYDFDCFPINRLAFSDGRSDVTIDDVLPLQSGYNQLNINDDVYLDLIKVTNHCPDGVYIKWINSLGTWDYWLFSKGQDFNTTKDKGELSNDFNNLEDTTSPYIQLGKESTSIVKVSEKNINPVYIDMFKDLFTSSKVYLFTGVPFSKNTFNDWIEVNVKAQQNKVGNSREGNFNFNLTIELPEEITREI